MADIPIAPIKRIMKENGATRVSEDAAQKLRDITEQFIKEIASEATKMAKHAGRKTVKASDISLAFKGYE